MAFKKGNSGNPSGRPKGSTNKTGGQLRELISGFLENRFQDVVTGFEEMEAKDKIKVYTDLLQYGLPKLQAVNNTIGFEQMTEDQLDEIIERLKQNKDE